MINHNNYKTMNDFSSMRVKELREELKRRGLRRYGLKAELVARLEDDERHELEMSAQIAAGNDKDCPICLQPGATYTIGCGCVDGVYHKRCWDKWQKQPSADGKCVICRQWPTGTTARNTGLCLARMLRWRRDLLIGVGGVGVGVAYRVVERVICGAAIYAWNRWIWRPGQYDV